MQEMRSSAQNSSGVHGCRRWVGFNRVPEKVPEKVPGSLGCKAKSSSTVPKKVAEAKPGQIHLTPGISSGGVSSAWLRSAFQKDL